MATKDLFIHSIQQIEVDGSKNIPTALYYNSADDYLIGYEALSASNDVLEINQDFKVDLGRHDSTAARQNQQTFPTASGEAKSAHKMTDDFISNVLRQVNVWLNMREVEEAAHVLIAEPLAMHEEEDSRWLENYRRNLREILAGRTSKEFPNIQFREVSFLPEPFAVFQYYRYGINHPLMSQNLKHQALILDFGGGTFDVCVIETTKEGDVSRSGRNSKPFGASSVPVGGFFINRAIAEYLYKQHLIQPSQSGQFHKGLKQYEKWRRNEQSLDTMRDEHRAFTLNFHRTSLELEASKISLCKQIQNWDLDAPLSAQTKVRLPSNPFVQKSPSTSVPFSATELRTIFLSEIWEKRLKSTISLCLSRALEDLGGQPISIVLLSGGSANIGWLQTALFKDFAQQLADAQVLPLPDFQEVVAKGLAVECARRFFTDSGDFGSVVYNRLCLMLDVNRTEESSDCRPRSFKPITPNLPNPDQPGVLLQSSSAIRAFIDQPMRWKVGQVSEEPKRLDYFFLRSSLNPDDLDNRFNFEEVTARAPAKCIFDKHLKFELLVKEDGTAIPKFIYHTGKTEDETVFTEGKPFALDVTYSPTTSGAKAFIGFDFGTSNSSVAFVESRSVREYQRRLGDVSWKELNEVAYELPYPIAEPVLAYLSEKPEKTLLFNAARRATEAMLAMLFYAALVDYRWLRQKEGHRNHSKVFGSLSQRSAGPLWAMLRQLFEGQGFGKKATFTSPIFELFQGENNQLIDVFVNEIAQQKHEKSEPPDHYRPLHTLANYCNRVFSKAKFGYFENQRRKKFSNQVIGSYRIAAGSPPFIKTHEVKLDSLVPDVMPYLLLPDSKIALPLSPMIFWWQDPKMQVFDHGFCYLFDFASRDGQSFSYKTVGRLDQLTVKNDHPDLKEFSQYIKKEREGESPLDTVGVEIITDSE